MSLKFYRRVLNRAWQDRAFRAKARSEVWHLLKQKIPARLITPRADYVYCRSIIEKGKGRWLPPRSLHLRPGAYGVVFDEAGRVLMVSDPFFGKRWSLPGGAVEPGETLEQALQREFMEETGLLVKVGAVVANIDQFLIMPTGQPTHGILHFYLAQVLGGNFLPDGNDFDTGAAAWLDIDSLALEQIGGDAIRGIVRRAHRLQKFEQDI